MTALNQGKFTRDFKSLLSDYHLKAKKIEVKPAKFSLGFAYYNKERITSIPHYTHQYKDSIMHATSTMPKILLHNQLVDEPIKPLILQEA
jgi:hypothetical protein